MSQPPKNNKRLVRGIHYGVQERAPNAQPMVSAENAGKTFIREVVHPPPRELTVDAKAIREAVHAHPFRKTTRVRSILP